MRLHTLLCAALACAVLSVQTVSAAEGADAPAPRARVSGHDDSGSSSGDELTALSGAFLMPNAKPGAESPKNIKELRLRAGGSSGSNYDALSSRPISPSFTGIVAQQHAEAVSLRDGGAACDEDIFGGLAECGDIFDPAACDADLAACDDDKLAACDADLSACDGDLHMAGVVPAGTTPTAFPPALDELAMEGFWERAAGALDDATQPAAAALSSGEGDPTASAAAPPAAEAEGQDRTEVVADDADSLVLANAQTHRRLFELYAEREEYEREVAQPLRAFHEEFLVETWQRMQQNLEAQERDTAKFNALHVNGMMKAEQQLATLKKPSLQPGEVTQEVLGLYRRVRQATKVGADPNKSADERRQERDRLLKAYWETEKGRQEQSKLRKFCRNPGQWANAYEAAGEISDRMASLYSLNSKLNKDILLPLVRDRRVERERAVAHMLREKLLAMYGGAQDCDCVGAALPATPEDDQESMKRYNEVRGEACLGEYKRTCLHNDFDAMKQRARDEVKAHRRYSDALYADDAFIEPGKTFHELFAPEKLTCGGASAPNNKRGAKAKQAAPLPAPKPPARSRETAAKKTADLVVGGMEGEQPTAPASKTGRKRSRENFTRRQPGQPAPLAAAAGVASLRKWLGNGREFEFISQDDVVTFFDYAPRKIRLRGNPWYLPPKKMEGSEAPENGAMARVMATDTAPSVDACGSEPEVIDVC